MAKSSGNGASWKMVRIKKSTGYRWALKQAIKFGVFLVPSIVSEPHLLKGDFRPTYERD